MSEINDSAIMAALGRQMTQAVAKQAVSAGNLANLDTPNYRAKEASFGDVLNGEVQKLKMTITSHTWTMTDIIGNQPPRSE